jgi:integrase
VARSIIGTVPRIADVDFVFSITHRSPVSGFSKFKDRLDATLGIAPWRLHDLRRTAATGMGNLNADLHVIERLLNHSSGSRSQLSRIYNKAKYTEASRNAMERWAERVAKVVESRVAEK